MSLVPGAFLRAHLMLSWLPEFCQTDFLNTLQCFIQKSHCTAAFQASHPWDKGQCLLQSCSPDKHSQEEIRALKGTIRDWSALDVLALEAQRRLWWEAGAWELASALGMRDMRL